MHRLAASLACPRPLSRHISLEKSTSAPFHEVVRATWHVLWIGVRCAPQAEQTVHLLGKPPRRVLERVTKSFALIGYDLRRHEPIAGQPPPSLETLVDKFCAGLIRFFDKLIPPPDKKTMARPEPRSRPLPPLPWSRLGCAGGEREGRRQGGIVRRGVLSVAVAPSPLPQRTDCSRSCCNRNGITQQTPRNERPAPHAHLSQEDGIATARQARAAELRSGPSEAWAL